MSLGISEMILNKTCELHWDLSLYLVENGKQIIRDSQVRIVFQLVVSIIDQKDMMCPDSRDIVLSDTFLEKLTNKPWLHVTQVRDEILARMTISGVGRPLRNASDNYKHLVRRFFPSNPSRNEEAHALPTVHAVIPLHLVGDGKEFQCSALGLRVNLACQVRLHIEPGDSLYHKKEKPAAKSV